MSKKIAFDTLDYARMLQKGGVEYAEVHAASLAESIVQNIYTKDEIDKMIEKTFKEYNERFDRTIREFHERTQEMKMEMKEIENRMEKIYMRSVMTTISVLGTLIVIVGAVSTFAHYLFH